MPPRRTLFVYARDDKGKEIWLTHNEWIKATKRFRKWKARVEK